MARPFPLALLAVAAALAAGCSDAPPSSGCTPEDPCGDEIVEGVNLSALFAQAFGAERDAVRERWAARAAAATSGPSSPDVELVAEGEDATGAEVRVLAGLDRATRDTLFVAAVRRPIRAAGDARRRPVLLVLPEAPGAVLADELAGQTGLAASLRDEVVAVGLAYRGQTLTLGRRRFSSDAAAVPYVTDVDDAQALLAYVATSEPTANGEQLAASGLGRGGTAALLLRARGVVPNATLDLAVSYGAPTSWFAPSAVNAVRSFLAAGTVPPLPDFQSVMDAAVLPLQRGEIPLEEARLRLLDRSPAPFLVPRPTDPAGVLVVAAHGRADSVVPTDHAGQLLGVVGTSGLVLVVDGETHTSVRDTESVVSAVSEALRDRFGLGGR